MESFSRAVQYDVLKYSQPQQTANFPPIVTGSGWSQRINLDGIATYCGGLGGGSMAYTQLFRNGIIEAVEAYWLNIDRSGGIRTLPHLVVEREILEYLRTLFDIQRGLGVNPPIAVALTLTETKGLEMASDMYAFDRGGQIAEDNLILPKTVVESFDESPSKILRPLFDLIWNACGYAKSKNFDDQGNWIGR